MGLSGFWCRGTVIEVFIDDSETSVVEDRGQPVRIWTDREFEFNSVNAYGE